jgi:UDP-N-acetyl-D-glucosamine dehydrogenase
MPEYTVSRIAKILNRHQKPVNGSKILVLGVAYKQDIDDYRESPALKVIANLLDQKAIISYYDAHVFEFKYKNIEMKSLVNLTAGLISSYDLVVITTAHSDVDYQLVLENSKLLFDTKNVLRSSIKSKNYEVL